MTSERLTVPSADGRTLEVLTDGPADGLPFVFHTGTPAGLVGYGPMMETAAALGLRTVGAWLADHLPGARAHLLPGEGHLTLPVTAFSQILADLLDLAGVSPAGA